MMEIIETLNYLVLTEKTFSAFFSENYDIKCIYLSIM